MAILVTGGAGFIGSHLVDRLLEKGEKVVVVDWEKKNRQFFHAEGAEYIRASFADDSVTTRVRSGEFSAIFHLAAQTSVVTSVEDPVADLEVNILESLKLLEAARQGKVEYFCFTSTGGAIYGDAKVTPTPCLQDAEPMSPYGVAKLSFERYLGAYRQMYGFKSGVLRPANVYGPRQVLEVPAGDGGVIPIFLHRLLVTGEVIRIFGDGEQTRDLVHVDDVVDAFLAAYEARKEGVWNIGTGVETSVNALMEALLEIHGATHPSEHAPERAGEVRRSALLCDVTERDLGWKARVELEEGLRKTYAWWKGRG